MDVHGRPGEGQMLSILAIKIGTMSESLELTLTTARYLLNIVNEGPLPFHNRLVGHLV